MQLGMVGLGRMGANMTLRLLRARHDVVVYDRDASRVDQLARAGARGASSLEALIDTLDAPRAVWLMLPAGAPTEAVIDATADRLTPNDTILDGGNAHYKDDVRRARELGKKNLHYVDVGTSGGVWGLERGYSLMIGGATDVVSRLEPVFAALAPGTEGAANSATRVGTAAKGYLHCGPAGAGHFVKMVHNGIEYGLMQAYAEGFDVMRHAGDSQRPGDERYDLPLADIAEVWRHGSVVGSWLLDLIALALAEDPELDQFTGFVQDSGEGRWTLQAAIDEAVPTHVLAAALFARFRSRQASTFADKLLSAMRYKFGGHGERPAGG